MKNLNRSLERETYERYKQLIQTKVFPYQSTKVVHREPLVIFAQILFDSLQVISMLRFTRMFEKPN